MVSSDEAQLYQGRFNFTRPLVISHEQHEMNSQAYSGVNTTADVSKYLRIFFPAITDDVVNKLLDLYPESDYSSPGLRFADMKQSLDLTAHDYALTRALGNNTWNAMVALGEATHGTDQSYYCMLFSLSGFVLDGLYVQGTADTAYQALLVEWVALLLIPMLRYVLSQTPLTGHLY